MNIKNRFIFVSDDVMLCRKVEVESLDEPTVSLIEATNDCGRAIEHTKKYLPAVVVVAPFNSEDDVCVEYYLAFCSMKINVELSIVPKLLVLTENESECRLFNGVSTVFVKKPSRDVARTVVMEARRVMLNDAYNNMAVLNVPRKDAFPRRLTMEDWVNAWFVRLGVYEKIGAVYLSYAIPCVAEKWACASTFKLNDVYEAIEDHFKIESRKTIETAVRTLIKTIDYTKIYEINENCAENAKTKVVFTPKRLVMYLYGLLKHEFANH